MSAILWSFARIAAQGQIAPSQEPSARELLQQFKNEKTFWKQLEVAKKLVRLGDATILQDPGLIEMLTSEDRHLRDSAALVFGRLGNDRGFEVLRAMLDDKSDRPMGQGQAVASSNGRFQVAEQVRADRYYTVHMFGELKNRRALPLLIPLLSDPESSIRAKAAWSLGEIGDGSALDSLLEIVGDSNLHVRAAATEAIEKLRLKQLVPPHYPAPDKNYVCRRMPLVSLC